MQRIFVKYCTMIAIYGIWIEVTFRLRWPGELSTMGTYNGAKRVRLWILKLAFKLVNLSLVYQIALKWSVKIIQKIILVQIMSFSTWWFHSDFFFETVRVRCALVIVTLLASLLASLLAELLASLLAELIASLLAELLASLLVESIVRISKGKDNLILSLWMKLSITITL